MADILILGYTAPKHAPILAAQGLTQTVFSKEYATWLSRYAAKAACRVKVHFKVDTGMCRLGFAVTDIDAILQAACLPYLIPCGLFSHFPCADSDVIATRAAFFRFLSCRSTLRAQGLRLFSHVAASAALLALPETALDGVRIGLALYGVPPVKTALPLTPTLTLTAPVVQIRHVATGTPIGYGGAFVAKRPSRIGILPIGYGDGLRRDLEKAPGSVTFYCNNIPFSAPIAGHICMDMMAVDLTNTPVLLGDHATIFSDPRPIATALHSIPWEVLTALHPRILRKRR
jgi:alanine racemase